MFFRKSILPLYALIATIGLAYTLHHYDVPHKLRLKYFPSGEVNVPVWPGTFLDNGKLTEQIEFYQNIYHHPAKIVMLGTSLTYRANWNELLQRNDVVNRGAGADVTAGLFYRLPAVLAARPKICFVEGGVNDVSMGVGIALITQNLQRIGDTLKAHAITPVLQTVTYMGRHNPQAARFRQRADSVNAFIYQYAAEHHLPVIDLNAQLSENGFLKDGFAQKDGVHFTGSAYLVWKAEVDRVLREEGL